VHRAPAAKGQGIASLKRFESKYASRTPDRRMLNIYAADPMSGRRPRYRTAIDINNEPLLERGPSGAVIEVVDYDAEHKRFYSRIDLNDPALLMQNGLAPNESDPRFHQQMVYAVAMKAIENARRALGRPISFRQSSRRPKLRLFPHAFYGANAFFDPDCNAIFFGYFKASASNPGPNLPGQMVFTCLSHDVVAHEVTHAIVHRLRRYFLEPTNVDVLAFHEAFADIVALFQRFSYRDILREHIQAARGRLQGESMLVELAQQVGYASGAGQALRSALGQKADPALLGRVHEPHRRGAILVSAVFDGFFRTYERRIEDLIRIATGGSGELPRGHLHPDLVNRVAREASQLAEHVLRMCIRAFDYMPPVDVTFGDFLRALVTADLELNPDDPYELRFNMIEGFRARGIYPEGVLSLAEESLVWPSWSDFDTGLSELEPSLLMNMQTLFALNASALDWTGRVVERKRPSRAYQTFQRSVFESGEAEAEDAEDAALPALDSERGLRKNIYQELTRYGKKNAVALGFNPDVRLPIAVSGFHPVHRIGIDQRLLVEMIAQFVQTDAGRKEEFGGIPMRAGATVIFGADGTVRYVIAKPMPFAGQTAECAQLAKARERRQRSFVEQIDLADPWLAWGDEEYRRQRMELRKSLAALHSGIP
jgi:hypothetical protein